MSLLSSVCSFIHEGPENMTIGCPNLVQEDSDEIQICTRLERPMPRFSGPTWKKTNENKYIRLFRGVRNGNVWSLAPYN